MIAAAKAVKLSNEPLSLRKAAAEFGVHYKALERFCKRLSGSELESTKYHVKLGYKKPRQVFSEIEEEMLESYLKRSCDIYFGLTTKEVRQLAHSYAKFLRKTMPLSWSEK